jgi:hypothetical protein
MAWEALQEAKVGEKLELKGFLFQSNDGAWILSKDPDLKSCCIGSAHKRDSQVTLLGEFSTYSTNKPLQVTGTLHAATEGYILAETDVIQKGSFPIWTVGGACIVCLVLVGVKLKRLLLP